MTYLIITFIIGQIILIHELGHLLAAKWAGIPIQTFSIGFGPKLIAFTRRDTEYRISLIPLGGYVLPKIESEQDFYLISPAKRIVMSLGGPAANIILPLFVFAVMNTFSSGPSFMGIFILPFSQTASMLMKIASAMPVAFTNPDNLSGIVGIVKIGEGFVGYDIARAMSFSALMSINLAIFNLLPLPVLDGGKVLLYLMETISPRFVKIQMPLILAGWIIMAGLMIYATIGDIVKLA